MARENITRVKCNHCHQQQEVSSQSSYPSSWKEFAIRETGPVDKEEVLTIDLCPGCVNIISEVRYGKALVQA